ncbi:uncharacterized protein LOC127860333 [Dreissena polymorpha]|uniref:uncharacterized protein LOC127860333 n=1 Tax=Dreissena polymorpha TaxID=45954 RepID=UPI002264954B|nr:uncharacterized protein LOC127860333 [Dreissena polymorpha]
MCLHKLVCAFILATATVKVTGEEYYITTSFTSWNNVPKDCRMAQPEYGHDTDTGTIILRRNIILNATLQHDVWIGYFMALTQFEYHGCTMLTTPDYLNVTSLVDCHYACNGTYFGLDCSSKELKCTCVDELPDSLLRSLCFAHEDFVCGKGNRQAIYSFTNDITSIEQNKATIANMCMASASKPNKSAWVKCKDENKERRVWCRTAETGEQFVSDETFAAWNEANDFCAYKSSLPSSAVGYNSDNIDNKAFTNSFRNWTLQQGNGSTNVGPMMFAYVSPNSQEIRFSANANKPKHVLCIGQKPTTIVTTTSLNNTQSTTASTTTDDHSNASKQQASLEGSTTTVVAAGVSVTVALTVAVVVIILVLRNRNKLCFANTKRSALVNRDDDHPISLGRVTHKSTAYFQTLETSVSIQTYTALQKESACTKDADKDNPVANADVTNQNTNTRPSQHDSEARAYVVLDKDGFKQQISATNGIPTEVNDYFVLEKQQPNKGNSNGVSTNEVHPYFVLENEGDRPFQDIPPQAGDAYFVLEKQPKGNSPPIKTANALELDNFDGDTYQEIDTNDTYASIDDSREDNNDYDYTNKGFKDSRKEISNNIYNHLNSAGDEYDHVGKGQNNVKAMENHYDMSSSAVRK